MAGKGREKEQYCVCGGPAKGFMLSCDNCEGWFHATCMVSSGCMHRTHILLASRSLFGFLGILQFDA
jgi:hypothetical protein